MKTETKTALKKILYKKGKKVLSIGAHPDDIEWGCGGALARLIREGALCYNLILTDGSKGFKDLKSSIGGVKRRKKEQESASKSLGDKKNFFLDFVDGTLDSPLPLRKKIVEVIRKVKPDIVFTFDPAARTLDHPDHRVCGQAALDAIYPCARDQLYYPELMKSGLKPHKVQEVFMFFTDDPNIFVDISDTIDIKVEALGEHASQFPDKKELKNNIYREARKVGSGHGTEFAEQFRYMKMPL